MTQGAVVIMTCEQRIETNHRVRSLTLEARSIRRARIVQLAADGLGNQDNARRREISRGQVIAWRDRFAAGGVQAIESDLLRSGQVTAPSLAPTRSKFTRPWPVVFGPFACSRQVAEHQSEELRSHNSGVLAPSIASLAHILSSARPVPFNEIEALLG